jgi:hypothetical protein
MNKKLLLAAVLAALAPAASAQSLVFAEAAASASRASSERAALTDAIARVLDLYDAAPDGVNRSVHPERCLGETGRNAYQRDIASLAITGFRLAKGGPLPAAKDELAFPASQLLEYGQSACMTFASPEQRAAWNGALRVLGGTARP